MHYRLGNFDQALELATDSEPNQSDVHSMGRLAVYALVHHAQDNPDSAQAFLLKALTLQKTPGVAQDFRAKHIDSENFHLVDDAIELMQQ